ncbi:MAG: peptidylprolyl isomerase, partial [Schleiferiaceae bacterium]|nr:peptidylprolyl isomerase [Schleiferiaceae bacterium]
MSDLSQGLYAKFHTSRGVIITELYHKQTPMTVGNFVALAKGLQTNDSKSEGEPYYDGLKFHRVIADFMVQGGCPKGTGAGGPGYQFDDEIVAELKHDAPGVLSMANAG